MQIKKKLLDIVRDKIRVKHYSIKTEKSYVGWIKHYIFYHNKKHPIEMGKDEIGHKSVETTMIYTHVVAEMNKGRVVSPLDM